MRSLGKKPTQCHPGDCRAQSDSLAEAMIGSPGHTSQSTEMLHIQEVKKKADPSERSWYSRVERRRGIQVEKPEAGYA